MICPNCSTMSCYVCRAIITCVAWITNSTSQSANTILRGYDHFNQQPQAYNLPKDDTKCALWEDVNARHHQDVSISCSLFPPLTHLLQHRSPLLRKLLWTKPSKHNQISRLKRLRSTCHLHPPYQLNQHPGYIHISFTLGPCRLEAPLSKP